MRARVSRSQDLNRQLNEQIDEHVSRVGFPPSVLLAIGDESLSPIVGKRLRDRGCDVLEVRDAATFHQLLREGTHCDVLLLDEAQSLAGCSPLHGLAYARRHGLDAPAIALVRLEDDHARTEARRLDLLLCARAVVLGSLDRVLLTALLRVRYRTSRAA